MNDADLNKKLEQLAARVGRIERHLQLEPERPPPPSRAAPAPKATPAPTATPAPKAVKPPAAPPAAPPTRPGGPIRPARTKRKPRAPLEVRIGQNWAAWAGAIIIVFAVAFLVKLGYDSGWWTMMGPVTRCILVAVFGAALIAAGELTRRRLGVAASVGLFGAGLGTLYLDAFAAFAQVRVVSLEWSFALMAVVALLGFGVTLRTRFVAIGVLSVVGGYLTPWLLSAGWSYTLQVGIYLTMLLGVALALSMARAESFRLLRYVALGGAGVTGSTWLLSAIGGQWISALVLATVWWVMVVVEATVAAARGQSRNGNVVATLLATAWFVTAGCWVLRETQPAGTPWLGWFTLAVGGVAAAVALNYGPSVSTLTAWPKAAIDRLAVGLWAQAGVLLAVAVALRFDGFGQSIGWLAIGLGSIEIGRRLRLRAVDIFGLVVGALAVARITLLDWNLGGLGTVMLETGQVRLTAWSILALAAIVTTHAAARRLGPSWRAGPVVLAVLGTLGWLVLCRLDTEGLTTVVAWLLAATALIALEAVGRRQRYFEIGLVALWCAAVAWLFDAASTRLAGGAEITGRLPVLNAQMAVVAAIVAVGWWASRVLAVRHRGGTVAAAGATAGATAGWQVAVLGALLLLLVGFGFELDRVVEILRSGGRAVSMSFGLLRQLLFTMLWAVGAASIGLLARTVLAGRADGPDRGPRLLVRVAWSILIACVVKWLIGDTLYWTVIRDAGMSRTAWPVVNLQMITGLVVVASGLALYRLTLAAPPAKGGFPTGPGTWVAPAAALLLLWGLSFEVDRAITHAEATQAAAGASWPPMQLRELWWTLLWAAGGLAMIAWTRRRFTASMMKAGWFVLVGAAVAWLGLDTVAWRLAGDVPPSSVFFNVQFVVGAATAAMLGGGIALIRRAPEPMTTAVPYGLALIGLIGLWLGSLEIDRFASGLARNSDMARQTGWSVYWGLFAILLILLGFARRWAACRYAGLALLALTLAKVVTVDMAGVRYIYRVLSFLVVGLLLVGTSVGYARFWERRGKEH